jgi:hypothetical protein
MNITKNLGMLFLAIYLILAGLAAFVPAVSGFGTIESALALVAGILILVGK